jgi:hypothetical protein
LINTLRCKMLTVTIDTTGIDPYEAHEWADELTKVYADMEVEDVNISENKISFKAGFGLVTYLQELKSI